MDYFHIFNQQTSQTGELNVYLNANQMTLEDGRSHFIAERIKIKRFWQKFVVWRFSLTDKLCFKWGLNSVS